MSILMSRADVVWRMRGRGAADRRGRRVSGRPRKAAAPEPVVNGLQPTITEAGGAGPDRFTLVCPECGELGRHPFALLARKAFEEHADEDHPAKLSPMEQIRSLVDLSETAPGRWECVLGTETYRVCERGPGRFEVEVASRRAVIDAQMSTLDDARIVIGGHARLVSQALATAATLASQRISPANIISLE
ncbi:hypothetical protein HET69_22915 [Streptomyces sp. CJ_13]|uniref:hypothetical protein n=1 Tax=Streptomyces sp. CJ_13 TaxID=2724943 RepID=UPI001BDC9DEE|nr:hypothetical protein [Streptomyces sp. CJ_13]MBT1186770.1 hypothetical protein [Streptomyces sp. CJ_13]